jgi:ubiquinone/menaquinone biosynthesis C-methylase UbiE
MIDTSYEPFSRQPEYIEVNKCFIESLHLEDCPIVLDLACGTGTLTECLLEVHRSREIIGLDISHESLVLAQKHFMNQEFVRDKGNNHAKIETSSTSRVLFLRGTADCLPFRDQSVHAVVMGNSIHNLPDQDVLLREIRRILKPNGLFAFNTSFFAGTYPPGTENLYHEWLKLALAYIKMKDEQRQRQGLSGIPRKRGTSHQAFSKKWPTPEELATLLMRNSFAVKWFCHRTIMMNQRSLESVGAYAGLARVLLSGYPIKIACEALQAAAGSAFKAIGIKEVRRLWLEVVAVKR